jgi:hypothetical protein
MTILWEAFLWGTGVSWGVVSGVVLFCFLFPVIEIKTGRDKRRKKHEEYQDECLDALKHRNFLTQEMNEKLQRISTEIGIIADKK